MGDITVKNLSFSYGGDERLILKDINMEIEAGEFVCILGQSGCGKSTLLRLLAGLEQPTTGEILMQGVSAEGASLDKGVVFQDYGLFPWMKAGENILLALRQRFPKKDKKELKQTAVEMLEAVGLSASVYNKFPKELSGGMKQRVGIAQALLNNPKILILDEPTAGLDPKERVRFRNLLSEYAGDKIVILSTHIVSDIEAIADEVLLMKKGKFVLQGTVPELIHKANGKVWELSASPQEARQWQTKTTVANLRHEGKEIILRIISDNMPSERAVPCEATLEDLYLFYFPTEEGVK